MYFYCSNFGLLFYYTATEIVVREGKHTEISRRVELSYKQPINYNVRCSEKNKYLCPEQNGLLPQK